MVTKTAAARHPIAVMIDDHPDARPQAGFNAASVVWHAPAEGGVPRYMLVFQDKVAASVGPVRSARYYFIEWASEWKSTYAHAGGSPNALALLRQKGNGQLVYNADYARWGQPNAPYVWRVATRFAPHNVYTTGQQLRRLAARLGAKDAPVEAAWRFGEELPLEERRTGGSIRVTYRYNQIDYAYDRESNSYLRSVMGPEKLLLEADIVGSGRAIIAVNGKTISGRWLKKNASAPTTFVDSKGRPVAFVPGQTFIQVVQTGTSVKIVAGADPA
jgi:hypothetical protein